MPNARGRVLQSGSADPLPKAGGNSLVTYIVQTRSFVALWIVNSLLYH